MGIKKLSARRIERAESEKEALMALDPDNIKLADLKKVVEFLQKQYGN